jgi:ketosteroid isomerase-like protein
VQHIAPLPRACPLSLRAMLRPIQEEERMKQTPGRLARGCFLAAMLAFAASSISNGAPAAQKNKKSDDANAAAGLPTIPMPDTQQIDHDIGEMLGAFQVGDTEAMHKYYADNASFVRGTFEPPVVGWASYAKLYEQQKAAFPGMQLVRRNTLIFVHQDVSWASYQWEFLSTFNGKPFTARGQTTLVLNKVGGNWLIVHNHTSEICPEAESAPAKAPMQTPAQNAPATPGRP